MWALKTNIKDHHHIIVQNPIAVVTENLDEINFSLEKFVDDPDDMFA